MITDIRFNVDAQAYHADMLTDLPTLNQSTANLLVTKSPKHAWASHPLLGGRAKVTTPEMDYGTAIDEMLLGGGKRFQRLEHDAYRSNAAKADRDAALASGKIPLKAGQWEDLEELANSARKSLEFAGIELDGQSQVCVLWAETASNGTPVQCRALMDHVFVDRAEILDLKCVNTAHPNQLPKKAHAYGYAIQGAAYTSALEHVFPDMQGRVKFKNVWLERDFPHVVVVSEFDGEAAQYGRVMWQRAVDIWEECTRLNRWPAYAREVIRVGLPPYAMNELLEIEEEEADAA